ncbi:MAG: NAD(P)H-quinone oxidoreductase [Gemmatimonadaceae bacterium]|nr:NAD(P)H-quinone oxidoreductase [Gemmatimonadaceae bacterium]
MSLPPVMRAAVITAPGAPDVLRILERPLPAPAPGDLLVRVRASAVNRADLLQRIGRYPAPPGVPADIPGLEFAGEVAACGAGVEGFVVGDRVCGLVAGGAHAEYLVTDARTVARVPDGMSWEVAGAAPEVFITAHDAMVTQAGLRAGETVLVHAVGSGVGLAAVQLATALGARVFGTARGLAKLDAARVMGMVDGCQPGEGDWIARAMAGWTDGGGADVVVDLVGGDYTAGSLAAMAPRGRLMLIGALAGSKATMDLRTVLGRRLTIRGTVLRSRGLDERMAVIGAYERDVLPWLASGRLAPRIDARFELAELATAHALVESNGTVGKVALRFD